MQGLELPAPEEDKSLLPPGESWSLSAWLMLLCQLGFIRKIRSGELRGPGRR